MEYLSKIATNETLQFFLMIPVFLGAFYVAWRLSGSGRRLPDLFRSSPRLISCIVLTVIGVFSLTYMFSSHLEFQTGNASLNRVMVWIAGIYVAFFMYFLMVLTVTDLIRLIVCRKGERKTSRRVLVTASACIAAIVTLTGVVHARSIQTARYEMSSEKAFPRSLRIVEVSDLHMGSVVDTAHVQRVVDAVNACRPDIVVFPGDQFNRPTAVDVVDEEAMFEALTHIEASIGVYAVLGNHDPELDSDIYQKYLSESNITALDNGVLEIIPGDGARQPVVRTLIGASPDGSKAAAAAEISDRGAVILVGRTKLAEDKERVPLAELLEEAGVIQGSGKGSGDYYLLVLDHDPAGIKEAASCDADLVIAGHSHAGQFFPGTLFSRLIYPKGYSYGYAQTANENTGHVTTSIVSSGAGYFQTPIRIGTDSEIVCIDLSFGTQTEDD